MNSSGALDQFRNTTRILITKNALDGLYFNVTTLNGQYKTIKIWAYICIGKQDTFFTLYSQIAIPKVHIPGMETKYSCVIILSYVVKCLDKIFDSRSLLK